MNSSSGPDVVMVRRAGRGDSAAWEAIVDACGPGIHGLSRRFARHEAEAEDLTQEIFLKLFQNLGRYRGDVPFVGWALRLSRNLCIDHYRARRARPHDHRAEGEAAMESLAAADDPERRAVIAERRRLVERMLSEMSETLSLVWVLRDAQGLSEEDTAAFLDVPTGTVKSRLHRARADLVRRLEEHLGSVGGTGGGLREAGSC